MVKTKPRGQRWYVRIDNWHPARLNQLFSRHWAEAARQKRFDRDLVAVSVLGADVPRAQGHRLLGLEIVLGPRQRGGDPDCYWKSLCDALVACGALVDDNHQHVTLLPVTYSRGPRPATVILLEESEPRGQHHAPPPFDKKIMKLFLEKDAKVKAG